MDTAKGIVMEMSSNEVVVLTQQGQFLKCELPDRNVEIGDEITAPLKVMPKRMVTKKWWLIAAAAVFLIFVIPFQISKLTKPDMVAYLSVDINPSLEMSLDHNMKVIGVSELNNDATTILSKVKVKGLPAQDAVNRITDQAYKDGFIAKNKENAIVLTLTPTDKSIDLKNIEKKLINSAQSVLNKEKVDGLVQTINATASIRKEAIAMGLSPGKYAIYLESVNSGLKATTTEFREDSISKVITSAGGQVNDIVEKVHNEKNLDDLYKKYLSQINQSKPPKTTISSDQKPKEDKTKEQPEQNKDNDNKLNKVSKEKKDDNKEDNDKKRKTKKIWPYIDYREKNPDSNKDYGYKEHDNYRNYDNQREIDDNFKDYRSYKNNDD